MQWWPCFPASQLELTADRGDLGVDITQALQLFCSLNFDTSCIWNTLVQVYLGGLGLGDGTSDLEHSIMLRQRSLSSRNSLEDAAK